MIRVAADVAVTATGTGPDFDRVLDGAAATVWEKPEATTKRRKRAAQRLGTWCLLAAGSLTGKELKKLKKRDLDLALEYLWGERVETAAEGLMLMRICTVLMARLLYGEED